MAKLTCKRKSGIEDMTSESGIKYEYNWLNYLKLWPHWTFV